VAGCYARFIPIGIASEDDLNARSNYGYRGRDINHNCVLTMRCPEQFASLLRLIGSDQVLRHAF
jgi:hypothetical protein